jgi:hypothetical protein
MHMREPVCPLQVRLHQQLQLPSVPAIHERRGDHCYAWKLGDH